MKTLLTDSEFQQQHVPTSLKPGYDSFHKPLVNLLRGYQKKISWKTNMPKAFRKAGHSKLRVVIYCSEVFIERPKSLDAQVATWSDYKSHNTVKFLIGKSPVGYVTFLSDCYGGRSCDKFITSVDQVINLLLLIVVL